MSILQSTLQYKPLPGQEFATTVPPFHELPVDEYGELTMPTTAEELEAFSKPSVLISGGGIGGLTLALLLYKAKIPFLVLERAKKIKPLGSAISMGASVAPLFKQLGIWDEFVNRSKAYKTSLMYKEDLKHMHTMDASRLEECVGNNENIISRPELYDLLFKCVPRERILFGKKVLSSIQNEFSVMVRCSDNSSYHGDILVGADGAYSAVRQSLYNSLKKNQTLRSSDDVSLPFSCVCLVGQTVRLDPEDFPELKKDNSQINNILGTSTMCTWATLTTKQNTVCWIVIHFLDKDSSKRNDSFRNSEWGSDAAEALAREVRPFNVPGGKDGRGRTLGEYIDRTPPHLMSKVMLEEIVFDTWYGGRTVLLGDACHKMNPSGGLGGILAIHDAIALANWLSTLRFPWEEEIENVFKEYRRERYPVAKAAFEVSQMFARNLGKNVVSTLVRGIMKRLPPWLWNRIIVKMHSSRPQCSFLPLVTDIGKVKPTYQRSLHKTLAIHKELEESSSIGATGCNALSLSRLLRIIERMNHTLDREMKKRPAKWTRVLSPDAARIPD